MSLIVVLTKKRSSRLKNIMLRALENSAGVTEINSLGDIRCADGSKPLLLELKSPIKTKSENTITVFDSSYKGEAQGVSGISVAASSCPEAIKSIALSNCTAITCGTGPLDTLSIASCKNGGAMISLQREVHTLSGTVIEPCDISVKTDESVHIYPTLAACAVLLLNDIPFENGYRI